MELVLLNGCKTKRILRLYGDENENEILVFVYMVFKRKNTRLSSVQKSI